MKKKELTREAKVQLVADTITQLFFMAALLRDGRDILEEVATTSAHRANLAVSMAPVIAASGGDYEAVEQEHALYAKRAKAVLNLLNVLEDTERERKEFKESQAKTAVARDQLRGIFGGNL